MECPSCHNDKVQEYPVLIDGIDTYGFVAPSFNPFGLVSKVAKKAYLAATDQKRYICEKCGKVFIK